MPILSKQEKFHLLDTCTDALALWQPLVHEVLALPNNLIIDLTKQKLPKPTEAFLQTAAKHFAGQQKTFVVLVNDATMVKDDEGYVAVLTLSEATEYIFMEELQRDFDI